MSRKYTFQDDDIFNRKILGDQLAKIIHKSEELRDDSFVIAIDGSWGIGKSIFLEQCKNEIEIPHEELYKSLNASVVYYNAWENDDLEDAFTPLAYHIYNTFKMKQIEEKLKKIILKDFKDLSKQIASSVLKSYVQKIGIDEKLWNRIKQVFNKGKDIISEATVIPQSFEQLEQHNKLKKDFKDIIEKANNNVNSNNKLIIIIDELDRCRPTFAIETLEIIKHYFSIENVIFILGLDIEQLSYSIATIYGQNMDATGYLIRFVDIIMKIPTPEREDYIRQNTKLNNFLSEILEVVNEYNMSIREINKFLVNIELFYDDNCNNEEFIEQAFKFYMYLIAVKLKYPTEFKLILTKRFNKDSNSNRRANLIEIDANIFPPKLWDEIFALLTHGNNLLSVQQMLNAHNNAEKLVCLLDKNDIDNNLTIPVGQYIFKRIEMCVLDANTVVFKKKTNKLIV